MDGMSIGRVVQVSVIAYFKPCRGRLWLRSRSNWSGIAQNPLKTPSQFVGCAEGRLRCA